MNSYFIYLVIASSTIASPGPGVIMTLTNALKYGLGKSIPGIIGVSLGMFFISCIVGSGLRILVKKSAHAYIILKILGALYLLYLGVKLIKHRNNDIMLNAGSLSINGVQSFFHGSGITLISPKPILFFIALFPQFIDNGKSYFEQFLLLSLIFCFLLVVIHILYGLSAELIKNRAANHDYFKYVNSFGGAAYILFGLSLLTLTKE